MKYWPVAVIFIYFYVSNKSGSGRDSSSDRVAGEEAGAERVGSGATAGAGGPGGGEEQVDQTQEHEAQ